MTEETQHHSHKDVVNRLKRANGHLRSIIDMIDNQRPRVEIAQQLHAVEKAVTQAKKTLIHDHLEHCLADALDRPEKATRETLEEFTRISRYL
ncbi:metal-sensing transcriptional repressor [Rhodobacteraceae bacterium RKSG542]|uniref:metal-sensing transcriptional repressor n=1 Tax=Pseudovibrio flavus TaxID=2529854 RepID=UPI0012BD5CBB|nr:metal-sensing transcriptional repressor [Pseudovibrio flavus]MTI16224.1 metal-sensing transcriptional repressor [Pseudovibrio flavus]